MQHLFGGSVFVSLACFLSLSSVSWAWTLLAGNSPGFFASLSNHRPKIGGLRTFLEIFEILSDHHRGENLEVQTNSLLEQSESKEENLFGGHQKQT